MSGKRGRLLSILALAGGGTLAAGALADTIALYGAREAAEAALRAYPGVSVGSLSTDPLTGRIELRGLTMSTAHGALSVGRLAFRVPTSTWGLVSSAFAADPQVSADDVSIGPSDAPTTIKHIEAQGTAMTSADLKAVLDPASPLTTEQRIAKLDAKILRLSGVQNGRDKDRTIVANVVLTDVHKSHVASAVADGIVMGSTGGPPDATIEKLTASDVDLGLFRRMAEEARTDHAMPLSTVLGTLDMTGLVIEVPDKDGEVRLGGLHLDGLKTRPFLAKPGDPSYDGPEGPTLAADAADSVAVHSFELHDFAVKAVSEGEPVNVGAKRVALTDYGHLALGNATLEGLSVDGHTKNDGKDLAIKILLGSIGVNTVSVADFVEQRLTGSKSGSVPPAHFRIPELQSIAIRGLQMTVTGPAAANDPAGHTYSVFVDLKDMDLASANVQETIPTDITFSSHAQTVVTTDNAVMLAARLFGINSNTTQWTLSAHWDPASRQLATRNELISSGVGTVSSSISARNVGPDLLSTDPAIVQAAAPSVGPDTIDIRFTDGGATNFALGAIAFSEKMPPAKVRAGAAKAGSDFIAQTLGTSPKAKAIAAAYRAYLANPKSLHLVMTAKPDTTVTNMGDAKAPGDLFKRFDITLAANEPTTP